MGEESFHPIVLGKNNLDRANVISIRYTNNMKSIYKRRERCEACTHFTS